MQTWARIYFDLLYNLFLLVFLYTLLKHTLSSAPNRAGIMPCIMMAVIYALLPPLPYNINIIFSLFIDGLSILFLCFPMRVKNFFKILIQYKLILFVFIPIITFIHSLILSDGHTYTQNDYYAYFKSFICVSFLTIFYTLYISAKQFNVSQKRYKYCFIGAISIISFVLSYLTLYLCKRDITNTFLLPLILSFLYIAIGLVLLIYYKFISIYTENIKYKYEAEINHMQESYARQTKEALKELHSIRHDIKNHLIVIDGYAAQNNFAKIREYISKTSGRFTDIPLIESPSVLVSAILNEKSMLARQKNIACEITCDFTYLRADDFTMTTILGNLLDNALTAAAKCSDGWIHVSLRQADMLLLITVDNSHEESIHEKDGIFRSTKTEQPHLHGIGIRNVQKAVKNLNGQIEISHTQDTFHVEITLPNYI